MAAMGRPTGFRLVRDKVLSDIPARLNIEVWYERFSSHYSTPSYAMITAAWKKWLDMTRTGSLKR